MKVIWIIGALLLFGICAACYWFDDIYHVCFESYRTGNHGEFGDKYGALNTLFTGWAFVAAGSAYWVQYNALQEAKRQTAIVREQNMDAACFELLNYLETRKKAIGESKAKQQPFDWLEQLYKDKQWVNDYITKLQKCGTWYRIVMSWIDRVVTAFPNDKELQKKYVDNLLLSLSINEQRCLKCYSHCADDVDYNNDDILNKIQKIKYKLRPFLQNNAQADSIQRLLKAFFKDNTVESK